MTDYFPFVLIAFGFLLLALTYAAWIYWLMRSCSAGGKQGYTCNCCHERHSGTVSNMRNDDWLVLPGDVHYCPTCHRFFLPLMGWTKAPQKLRRFDGDADHPYEPPRGA
jgi:hypothetical protein